MDERMPRTGGFIAYKKARRLRDTEGRRAIIKLYIPANALRHESEQFDSIAFARKCRASRAKVLSITCAETGKALKVAASGHAKGFRYRVGEYVRPVEPFDKSTFTCASGIHFFMTEYAARRYFL